MHQQKSSVLPPYLLLFLPCQGDWLVAIVGTVPVREGVAAPESSCSEEVRVKSLICQCTDTLLKTALIKFSGFATSHLLFWCLENYYLKDNNGNWVVL